jgi:hypothetical protein
MPAFDWYQATVPRPLEDVLEALDGMAPGLKLSHGRGVHSYLHSVTLGNSDYGEVARVWHGGVNPHPHAVVSGQWAESGAKIIRGAFPQHSVSRLDVREDYIEPGAFDQIQPHLLDAATRFHVEVGTAGDHLLRMRARTTYVGSSSSPVRVRLYDKRAEVMDKLPPGTIPRAIAFQRAGYQQETFPDHWTRLEAQIKPKGKQAKALFATIEPVEAFGASPWLRHVWKAVEGTELEPVQCGSVWRPSDDERALRYMLKQYGPLLLGMKADLGSWACVGEQLGHELLLAKKAAH